MTKEEKEIERVMEKLEKSVREREINRKKGSGKNIGSK